MTDMEKVIKGIKECNLNGGLIGNCPYKDILSLLKERENEISRITNEYLNLAKVASKKPEIVRCKDCEWRGNKKKCILAFVADKQEFPLFLYDQRGEWFCADGERRKEQT